MYTMSNVLTSPVLLFFLLSSLALLNVEGVRTSKTTSRKLVGESPYTAKASFIRYWKRKVSGDLPEPWFLNKASPLNGVQLATFSKLADQNLITTQLPAFCSEANLLCTPEVSPHLAKNNEVFTTYFDRNFTNYGTKKVGGFDSFIMYAPDEFGSQSNRFSGYSANSIRHDDRFSNYGPDTTVDLQKFDTYGTSATGGTGNFSNYGDLADPPLLTFTTYSDNAHGRKQGFTTYSNNAGDGTETFINYGQNADGAAATNFTSYAQSADGMNSSFTSYGTNAPNQTFGFTTYGVNTTFKDYTKNGVSFANYKNGSSNSGLTTEATAHKSSDGVDVNFWKDYTKNGSSVSGLATEATAQKSSDGVDVNFWKDYTKNGSSVSGLETKATAHKSSDGVDVNFWKDYTKNGSSVSGLATEINAHKNSDGVDVNFWKDYSKNGSSVSSLATEATAHKSSDGVDVNFWKDYTKNVSSVSGLATEATAHKSSDGVDVNFWKDYTKNGSSVSVLTTEATANMRSDFKPIKRGIEPGKFFREDMLKAGKVMPMPDIRDKMPKRSFLPQRIVSKLPFSSIKITEMYKIFRARENSAVSVMIKSALNECERSPSPGETKRCVGSPEDMVDFATSVLGRNVAVKTTENTHGSEGDVLIGSVKAINGGKLTKSVSCHQSLFPYLLYYCHSVPKVRLYEADILNPTSKVKINHGVAICHIDTSSWSPNHGAFIALGPGPGKIEVCHWIFENDLVWTIAD